MVFRALVDGDLWPLASVGLRLVVESLPATLLQATLLGATVVFLVLYVLLNDFRPPNSLKQTV